MQNIIAPSVFGADLGNLKEQLTILEQNNIQWLHVDVMDGHFVEKMAFGPDHIRMLKKMTSLKLDVHLMVEKPERILDAVIDAGADMVTVHQESTARLASCIERIKKNNKKAGVVLSPATDENSLKYVLDQIDMILLMTINPGEAGQSFHPSMLDKIRQTRELCGARDIQIEVDGGIDNTNIALCQKAGANVFVSGGFIFRGDIAQNIAALNEQLN
ncbi:MAG: ribulose-phosphate 3-epimerase [Catenisphaera adipataccumulans]|jgi:ribulose-phosphate 3-epimerase|uniref:ribulose-phosphate 3-epimerase n=1 Tax=Catenisphaera adipataccumulans TaxID=700500 RepID=UPI003D8C151C